MLDWAHARAIGFSHVVSLGSQADVDLGDMLDYLGSDSRTRAIVLSIEAAAREEASHLHAGISVLDVCITVAPLLGLLGTASGLVTIFQGLGSNYDATNIARGIAIALNTTIFGLAIAVPCVVAHGYFTRRIEVLTARLESMLADFALLCQKMNPPH